VLNRVALAATIEAWRLIEGKFQKIMPADLLPLLEREVATAVFAPDAEPSGNVDEREFRTWCEQNGLRVPGEQYVDQQIAAERDESERRERLDAAIDDWRNGVEIV
jgi:hypothetical protein